MATFITSFNGLIATRASVAVPNLVRVDAYRQAGAVLLRASSGHNLASLPGRAVITNAEFADLQAADPYDGVATAAKALALVGWTAC